MLEAKPYTEKVDVYSAGVIFWELLTRDKYFGHLDFVSDICDRFVLQPDDILTIQRDSRHSPKNTSRLPSIIRRAYRAMLGK